MLIILNGGEGGRRNALALVVLAALPSEPLVIEALADSEGAVAVGDDRLFLMVARRGRCSGQGCGPARRPHSSTGYRPDAVLPPASVEAGGSEDSSDSRSRTARGFYFSRRKMKGIGVRGSDQGFVGGSREKKKR